MKARILGALFVLAILVALYVITDDESGANPPIQTQSAPVNPTDADLKNFKIN